ncbi:alpha/beta hydrolase [Gaiella sp.]|uniref:alpha/beta hydrolase family protein n=1 Tax=Gaiella sp. TaxID=2663207 RepID=UPI0032641DF5
MLNQHDGLESRTRFPPARQIAYGDHPDQVGNLHLPVGEGTWPTVVLIHGGFWKWGWDRTLMTLLAHDLARRGYAVWNIEYRRVGQEGGGWPGTLEDAAAAIDYIAGIDVVDPNRIVTVGHSAGGQLAVWLAARHRLPVGAPGSGPRVRPHAAVSLAGVLDLVRGAVAELGSGACAGLLGGGPDDVPERYATASPSALLPLGIPVLLVHGGRDDIVPSSQSHEYAAAACAAGDTVELVDLPCADHFDVVEADDPAWLAVVERLPALVGNGA